MELLADKQAPIEKELQDKCTVKIQNGDAKAGDLRDLITFFTQFCNSDENLQYEIHGMNQVFQFNLEDETYTIAFGNGKCESYAGVPDKPTVIFSIDIDTALDVIVGNIHSSVAQMNGDVIYTGPRPDAIAFQRIFELFLDEFI